MSLEAKSDSGCKLLYILIVNLQSERQQTDHFTLLCVYVPAPEGKSCCKRTAAEIEPVTSGASACSRHKRLPTGPLSPLSHEQIQVSILNESTQECIYNHIRLTFAPL